MKYKAVLFDFDYTLGDCTDGIVISINYALEKMGYAAMDRNLIRKTIGMSLANTFEYLAHNKNPDDADRFEMFYKEKSNEVIVDNTSMYPEAMEVIPALIRNGYIIGIVSTKYHFRLEQILKKFDLVDSIKIITGVDDVKAPKPSPEGLLNTINKLGLSKEEVLYVGDNIIDAQTASSAGVSFAAVLTGTTTRKEFEQYEFIYAEDNLLEIFNKIHMI